MGFRMQFTGGGYEMGQVASALQKEIRRGNEKQALYWAIELNSRYPYYLWRRLFIIASEDIGVANPQLIILICQMKKEVNELYKKHKDYDLAILGTAILLLCRSPKSREGDDFVNEVLREMRTHKLDLEIPDYALDMHTAKGKQLGRGVEYFWTEGARLENEAHQSAYQGYDPELGDGYKLADGTKVKLFDAEGKRKRPNRLSINEEGQGTFW